MNKILKRLTIGLAILAVVLFVAFQVLKTQTKKASPEDRIEFTQDGKSITIFYCQPSKKGRKIFGELVPYGKVWRTGANEASTFTTSHELNVGRQALEPGKYTLWTVPNEKHWTIIFNSKMYGWGVNIREEALHEPEFDALKLDVPVQTLDTPIEQFTIRINEMPELGMDLSWGQTKVRLPMSWK